MLFSVIGALWVVVITIITDVSKGAFSAKALMRSIWNSVAGLKSFVFWTTTSADTDMAINNINMKRCIGDFVAG